MCRLIAFSFFLVVSVFLTKGIEGRAPRRIVGASDAAVGEIPYQASLRRNDKHKCGGTIISKRHILTAAHCVNGTKPWDWTVLTGTNKLDFGGTTTGVSTINVHPRFKVGSGGTTKHDIAIVTLIEELKFNYYQSSIAFAREKSKPSVIGKVSGWGFEKFEDFPDGEYSRNLKKSDMTILSSKQCQHFHQYPIGNNMICGFRADFVGICTGDEGSPLVYEDTVVGVASWFFPCGLGLPDVYTDVYSYRRWIEEIVDESFDDDY